MRPQKRFLAAEWKNLIMANYKVDAVLLQPYLPYKTKLDTYNGNVYVSLVGFFFTNTRVMGITIPFHIHFQEVNLRFYVCHNDKGEQKRGVVFIKEIVPKPAITMVANSLYREKYNTMPMRHEYSGDSNELTMAYYWKYKNKWNSLQVTTHSKPIDIVEGSKEAFIAEHYWGYSKYNDTTTYEYAVEHPAWKIYPLKTYHIDCDFSALYGESFSVLQHARPDSVFVAQGSAISVFNKRKL